MIYISAKKEDLKSMNELWNEVVNIDGFYKPYTLLQYEKKMLTNPDFKFDNVILAKDNKVLVGFSILIDSNRNKDNAYLNALVVKEKYRNQGIGRELLRLTEKLAKDLNKKKLIATGFLPSCYEWYIPKTDKHDHPCAPGVSINSEIYLFLLHHGYKTFGYCDAFHLALSDYEISPSIKEILAKCEKEGIKIELYDKEKHFGIEDFYKDINIYDFEKVIKENLALEKPYPFLVVSQNGKVMGWTGAMWNEESGRGHFDGIAISNSLRGKGLGKALFSSLALYSKNNGAKFMTFYTGLTNYARYIYMGAGFKIAQSFCSLEKEL